MKRDDDRMILVCGAWCFVAGLAVALILFFLIDSVVTDCSSYKKDLKECRAKKD